MRRLDIEKTQHGGGGRKRYSNSLLGGASRRISLRNHGIDTSRRRRRRRRRRRARPLCLSQPLSPDTLLSLLSPASLPPVSSLLSPPFSSLLSLLFYGVWIHSSDIDCGWILTPREHFQSTSDPPLRRWPPTPASIESRLSSVLNSATRAPPPPASDHIVPRKRARPEQQLSETFWGRRKFARRTRC